MKVQTCENNFLAVSSKFNEKISIFFMKSELINR